ncbi:hypothetical protein NQ317_018117 [Molorchus minor]|uniref:Uncharacterized protein n=1 Tax=Molorchus minor TaxID=1323400 RepID=A0ABQ9JF20_9CUCU|nr:hypothetical protein NQ317_018117 [Molorchus minor]
MFYWYCYLSRTNRIVYAKSIGVKATDNDVNQAIYRHSIENNKVRDNKMFKVLKKLQLQSQNLLNDRIGLIMNMNTAQYANH